MADQLTVEEAEVQGVAGRNGLVLKRHPDGRYDFHDNEIGQDVSALGEPDRWRWNLAAARRYLDREGWTTDRHLYQEAEEIARGRGWHLVNDPNRRVWIVRDAHGADLAQGPFRTCVRWLREQSLAD